jgi:hypothetical protein
MKEKFVITGYAYVRDGVSYNTTNFHVAKRRSTTGVITTYFGLI